MVDKMLNVSQAREPHIYTIYTLNETRFIFTRNLDTFYSVCGVQLKLFVCSVFLWFEMRHLLKLD